MSDAAQPDAAAIRDLPHLVLDPDGLDLLELALGGALPASVALAALGAAPEGAGLVLTDAENTPLAVARPDGPGREPVIMQLRSYAHAAGPQWDPALRRSPADCRAALAASGVTALVADEVPTLGDVRTLGALAGEGTTLLVLAVGRRPGEPRRPGAGAIVRAWLGVLGSMDAGRQAGIVPVVVPWPRTAIPPLELAAVLAAYGATTVVRVEERRPADERDRLAALDGIVNREIHALYPAPSADEIDRARRNVRGPGAVVFFSGLSGSGKSTIAKALVADLEARGQHQVTLLDGDEVRQHLSRGLGFDAESRAINIDRIAYVASLIAAHGGVAVAAPIAPFDAGRKAARAMAQPNGAFLLVHVSTPLEVCEARDRKGLYARARAGEIPDFTGISSPYEEPDDADVTVDTTTSSVEGAVAAIRGALEARLRS